MRALVLVLIAGIFFASLTWADNSNTNRQILPIGESEAFLGNAGVGRAHDTGSVFYNPAGLMELDSGRVSMTGSLYLNFSTQSDAIVRFDNTDVGYQASGFNTIPAFYVATMRFSDLWSGAFSVLVPNYIEVENRVSFTTPNTRGNIVQNLRSNDLWLGVSLAHQIDSSWNIGVSLYGIQHQEAQTIALDANFPAMANNTVTTSLSQEKLSVLGLSAILGISYFVTDRFELGLRAQSPLIQMSGTADTFQSVHQVANGAVTSKGEDLRGTPAAYRLPVDFTLGTAWTPSDWAALLLDVSLQLGASYSSIPGSALSDSVNLKPTPRFNLGVELRPTPHLPIRAGFYYNPSANGMDPTQDGYLSENFYGVTAGVGINSSKVETGVGAFYLWSSGKAVPVNGNGSSSLLRSHASGVLLTVSYLL